MGLFINHGKHPDIYKNKKSIPIAKQEVVYHNLISELTKKQQKAHEEFTNSLQELKLYYERLEAIKRAQLHALDERHLKLEACFKQENSVQQSIIEQMQHMNKLNQEMVQRLEENEKNLGEQLKLLEKQEEIQADVLERLDQQEVLTEKISRQLNHLRSIIFERTNYLVERLENGYKLSSSYIYQLMTGSDQPLTFSMMNVTKEKKKED